MRSPLGLVAPLALLALGACASPPRRPAAPPGAAAPAKAGGAPQRVSLVEMISWAEPAPEGCDADLEGTAKPASFRLAYTEAGAAPVLIDSKPDDLFAHGWEIITRNVRGLGFERVAEFQRIDFDVVEELRCRCGEGDQQRKANHLLNIRVGWEAGKTPVVSARMLDGGAPEEVRPTTINGRLPSWEFHFVRAAPGRPGAECSSRFFAVLGVDRPLE